MNKFKTIKPWVKYLKAFFVLFSVMLQGQNSMSAEIKADNIKEISVDGNQIFNINITTTNTDVIKIHSLVDGEYQDYFQVVSEQVEGILYLKLEKQPLSIIADDKRNAHKVVAVNLSVEIPEKINLNIVSDIGFVDAKGDFNLLYIELVQGNCNVIGTVAKAIINTIDGHINVETKNANIKATTNNGIVSIDEFKSIETYWKLQSINGDITVRNQE